MKTKIVVRTLSDYVTLYRDSVSGIAWVEDTSTGMGHSAHPNIHASGSVSGMKARGYWGKKDRAVRSHGFIYNADILYTSDELDRLAAQHCECVGCKERKIV